VVIYANLCRNAVFFFVIRNVTCPESSFHYIQACGILANFTHFQYSKLVWFLSSFQTKRDFQISVSTLSDLLNFYRIVENVKVFKAFFCSVNPLTQCFLCWSELLEFTPMVRGLCLFFGKIKLLNTWLLTNNGNTLWYTLH